MEITISTSSFRISGNHPDAVSISRGVPRGWKGRRYMPLAPSWALIKEKDEYEYRRRYKSEVLDKLNPVTVVSELGPRAILLCWEAPGEFCHRRLVAKWLKETLGISVNEI